jgi:hypothetical protein
MLSLFSPSVKILEYLKSVTEMCNLPAETKVILLLPMIYGTRECENISCCKQELIYTAELVCEEIEKQFLEYASKLPPQKKLKIEYTFFVKIFLNLTL